jgi:hypothetical protein
MRMKKLSVTFERTISITVYAPEDMADAEIEDVAHDLAADGLRDWDPDDWEAQVSASKEVTIPDDVLRCSPPNAYGYRRCLVPQFNADQVVVVNDDRTDFVAPEDAQWWVVPDAEEKQA